MKKLNFAQKLFAMAYCGSHQLRTILQKNVKWYEVVMQKDPKFVFVVNCD